MSQFVCGLETLFVGDGGGVSMLIDESMDRTGPVPSTANWLVAKGPKALQRPIIFNQRSFEEFRTIPPRPTDVLVAGYPRCGTSWAHAMVYFLLRSDEDGTLKDSPTKSVGGVCPVYCESRSSSKYNASSVAAQPDPRIMTTHARPSNWPGTDSVVVIVRDPRDVLVSTFFRIREIAEEMRAFENVDGRIALCARACAKQSLENVYDDFNDDGSVNHILSILMDDEEEEEEQLKNKKPNGRFYADWYTWHREADKTPRRRIVITYESLHEDPSQIARDLAAFLKVPHTPLKIAKCVEYASFNSTQNRGDNALRKGVVGDHKIYLTKEHWDAMACKVIKTFYKSRAFAPLVARIARETPTAVPTHLKGKLLPHTQSLNDDDEDDDDDEYGSEESDLISISAYQGAGGARQEKSQPQSSSLSPPKGEDEQRQQPAEQVPTTIISPRAQNKQPPTSTTSKATKLRAKVTSSFRGGKSASAKAPLERV